jgi:hypothetical protein
MQWSKEEEQEEKTNNNLQNTTENNRSSNTILTKTVGELRCFGKVVPLLLIFGSVASL